LFFVLLVIGVFAEKTPDAVFHKIVKEYTIHEDGSYDFRYYKELELNTLFAFNRLYGETFVVYNPEYQDLKINSSYTIMKSGKKITTPQNAFNLVLPRQAKDFPAYNHLREMVITHTGIEPGATIYLDYTVSTKKGFVDNFSFTDNIKKNSPIKNMEIIIKTPKGYGLNYKMLNLRTAPEIKESKKGVEYRWLFKSITPTPYEGAVDHKSEPLLLVQKNKELSAAIKGELSIADYSYKLPKTLCKKVTEITKEAKNDINKVLDIQSFVISEIDNSHLSQQYIGKELRSIQNIYASNIATNTEKAFLCAAMIREAGIYAEPILVYPKQGLPILKAGQILVRVEIKDYKPLYINPTHKNSQNLLYSLSDVNVVSLSKGKLVSDKLPASSEIKFSGKIEVGKNILGEVSLKLSGNANPYLKLAESEKAAKSLVKNMAGHINTSKIESLSMDVTKISYDLKNDDYTFNTEGDLKTFLLPTVAGGIITSTTPLLLNKDINESYNLKIDVAGVKCINIDINKKQSFDIGTVSVKVVNKGNHVTVKKSLKINKRVIRPADYNDFKILMNIWFDKDYEKLYLK
ncbi:MAG: DUF3857 domain-containing protein, partial [Bacteroidota bacterium]|nr:DUF3857 domain-containing protein [Bacteroidota bacterium]